MICTNCGDVTRNAIEVGELFNCSPDTSVVCSEKCEKEITEKVENGTWIDNRRIFRVTSE